MTDKLPPIYFYIPEKQWPAGYVPNSPEEYGQWMSSWGSRYGRGKYDWTLLTYLHLKADGFPCELINHIPAEGIVVAHKDFFSDNLRPSPKLLIVCIKVDRDPHPYSQVQIVQNLQDEMLKRSQKLWQSHTIRLWVQSGLIPRDSARGDRFENIGFFGVTGTLAPELQQPEWEEKLHKLGLRWQIVEPNRWHDYSEKDAIVAVRSFDGNTFDSKPPSKLINAWLADVPAILGCETAYSKERRSELDYLEVASVEETINALCRLRDDRNLRQAMVENGRIRGKEMGNPSIVSRWRYFLTEVATPAYYRWYKAGKWYQQTFLLYRYLNLKVNSLKLRLQKLLGLRNS